MERFFVLLVMPMQYSQKVIIKNTDYEKVREAFHSIELVRFLTYLQPINIIEWSGIENGKTAYFKLWFFGWKDFKVVHENYQSDNNHLFFVDKGIKLPLGIAFWKHEHRVFKDKKNTIIEDSLSFNHRNKYIGYLLFPVLVFPIFVRRVLYKIYF